MSTCPTAQREVASAGRGRTLPERADGRTAGHGRRQSWARYTQGGERHRPPHLQRAREPAPRPGRIREVADGHGVQLHTLFVDDNSPDGTGAAPRRDRRRGCRASTSCTAPASSGLGTAYIDGFRWGLARGYEYLFEMDADFSHDPTYLPQCCAALDDGADVVVGSRYVPGGGTENWGLGRKLISQRRRLYARTDPRRRRPRPHRRLHVLPPRRRSRRSTSTRVDARTATASRSR